MNKQIVTNTIEALKQYTTAVIFHTVIAQTLTLASLRVNATFSMLMLAGSAVNHLHHQPASQVIHAYLCDC